MADQIQIKVGIDAKEAKTGLEELKAQQAAIKKQAADKFSEAKYDAEAAAVRKKAAFDQLSTSEKVLALERQRLSIARQILATENAADKAKLGAKLAQTESDLVNAKAARKSSIKGAALGGGALVAGAAIAVGADILQDAGKIADVAAQFGIGAEGLQRITNVASMAGVSIEEVGAALNKTAISQQKARKGSEEHLDALKTLGVSASEYINLNPEEAFYRVADAVKNSTDRTAAYAAVQQLMGKSSGALFTTLEMGGAAIRKNGEDIGVMSEATIKRLDEIGDQIATIYNQIKVYGAKAVIFLFNVGESFYQSFKYYAEKLNAALGFKDSEEKARAAKKRLKEIWEDGQADGPKKPAAAIQLEDDAAAKKGADEKQKAEEKLAQLRETVADKRKKADFDALSNAEQMNMLLFQQDKLTLDMAYASNETNRLTAQEKLIDVQNELLKRREKADEDATKTAETLAAKKQALAEKEFKASLNGMTAEEKKNALLEKRLKLTEEINSATDEGKKIDLQSKLLDLNSEINGIKESPAQKSRLIAGGLTNLGTGYAAALSRPSDSAERAAKAAEKAARAAEDSKKVLDKIEAKVGPSLWNK